MNGPAGDADPDRFQRTRSRQLAWFPALLLFVTIVELIAAVVVPGVTQFDDKGWSVRLVAYPFPRTADLVQPVLAERVLRGVGPRDVGRIAARRVAGRTLRGSEWCHPRTCPASTTPTSGWIPSPACP